MGIDNIEENIESVTTKSAANNDDDNIVNNDDSQIHEVSNIVNKSSEFVSTVETIEKEKIVDIEHNTEVAATSLLPVKDYSNIEVVIINDEASNQVKVIKTADNFVVDTVPCKDDDKTDNNKRKKVDSPLENDDKKARRYPKQGMVIWVFEEGGTFKYLVGAKKDALANGGCFNCTDEHGQRVSLNFNKFKWEEINDDEGECSKSIVGLGATGDVPPLPPRTPPGCIVAPPTQPPPPLPPLLTQLDDRISAKKAGNTIL